MDTNQDAAEMVDENVEMPYEQKLNLVNEIAKPIVNKKWAKRILKLIRKAAAQPKCLRRGLKEVQTRMRKGETGICVLAGDVTPIDVYCHLPIMCEDNNIPYCYVPLKRDISNAIGAKRPCIVALIRPHEYYKELYNQCFDKLNQLTV
ncbi:H/ACA ribonucleoprotein complex subunit 2-like protein, partial [Fragariocoptes setiger]